MSEPEPRRLDELVILDDGGIEGLTPNLLTDLEDIVRTYGHVDPDGELVIFGHDNPFNTYISAGIRPESHGFFITKDRNKEIAVITTNHGPIFWGRTLTAEEATGLVDNVNKLAKEVGLYDPETGKRKPFPEPTILPPAKYRVDEIFETAGSVYLLMPTQNPEKELQKFDRPEELVVEVDELGFGRIYKKSSVDHLEKRKRIVEGILLERGLDTSDLLKAMEGLSIKDVLEIRAEIERRMREDSQPKN